MSPTLSIAGPREAGVVCPHCGLGVAEGGRVATCRACGTVHHEACWERHAGEVDGEGVAQGGSGGCGSYACAPARRERLSVGGVVGGGGAAAGQSAVWTISADEINRVGGVRAVPLPGLARRQTNPGTGISSPASAPSRTSRLAIWSLICAVVGIPLFGLVTGAVAVVLASFSLGAIAKGHVRGTWIAVAGLTLGLVDCLVWLVIIASFASGMSGGGGHFGGPGHSLISAEATRLTSQDLAELSPQLRQAMRANVLITTGRSAIGRSMGSGVILEIAGGQAVILTNHHVLARGGGGGRAARQRDLARMPAVSVYFLGDDSAREGRVIWLAPEGIDAALITACCEGTEAMAANWSITGTSGLRPGLPAIGDPVFAIGNPRGWGWTHSQGSVSQLRTWRTQGHTLQIIQTSAPLNPGNSGGGLYNQAGRLIGLNTWSTDKRFAEGLGFAIAIDDLLVLNPPLGLGGPQHANEGEQR